MGQAKGSKTMTKLTKKQRDQQEREYFAAMSDLDRMMEEQDAALDPVHTGVYREVDFGWGVGPGGIFQDSYGENRVLIEQFK